MDLEMFIAKDQYRFHYNRLSAIDKKAYDAMVKGFFQMDKMISLPVSRMKVQKIYDTICRDIPELFFVKDIQVKYYVYEKDSCRIIPNYRFHEDLIYGTFMEMESKLKPFLCKIVDMSDLQKEKEIHDYMVKNVTYKDKEKAHSHEAPGTILYGIGVCEGISKAFKYIADRAGLEAVVIYGFSSSSYQSPDHVPDTTNKINHAWNAVKVDDSWYHLDVTFDATITDKVIRYDYFNLSSKEISVDHRYDAAPLCPYGMNYYGLIGRFAASSSELKKMAKKYLTADVPMVFQLPKIEEFDKELLPTVVLDLISDSLWYKSFEGKTVSLKYNIDRMIFQAQID